MKGHITIRTHGTDMLGLFFLITVHFKENDTVSILREVLQEPPLLLPVANFLLLLRLSIRVILQQLPDYFMIL